MKKIAIGLFIPALVILNGCAAKQCGCRGMKPAPAHAQTEIKPLTESTVTGRLEFENVAGGVRVHGNISGLLPGSKHGFHVHEKGDCSAPDGMSAGGHFMVGNELHAGLHDKMSHTGDFGNIEADAQGVAHVDLIKEGATLGKRETSLLGRSVIVHKDADDLHTQPTGASGARIACGVIQP